MFAGGAEHFGAPEAAGAVGVQAQAAGILALDAGAALVAEIHGAEDEARILRIIGFADARRLRVGEDHGEGRPTARRGEAGFAGGEQPGGVGAGDAALAGGLVQHRPVGVGVPGDEDRRMGAEECPRVEVGNPVVAEREAGGVEPEPVEVRRAPGGGEDAREMPRVGFTPRVRPVQAHALPVLFGRRDFCPEMERDLGAEEARRLLGEAGIAQGGEVRAGVEQADGDAEAGEGLGEFEPHRSAAEHRQGGRQVGDLEQGVGGEHAVPEVAQGPRYHRA